MAFIFGADALDRSIKTVDQAENTVGLPVFAAVPETTDEGPVSRLKRKSRRAFGSSNYRVVVETPESPAAEAFRMSGKRGVEVDALDLALRLWR